MTIAEEYFEATGETVGAACLRLYAAGVKVNAASNRIGYSSSSDLRKYLERRGIQCPWPKIGEDKPRGRPPYKLTDDKLEAFAALLKSGMTKTQAAKVVGHQKDHLVKSLKKRRPDLLAQ